MATNNGLLNEDEFVYYLNERTPKELSDNLFNLMRFLFGVIDDSKQITCEKTKNYIKPDFVITHMNQEKAISLKSGHSRIVHSENIKPFILFLRELGVSLETQKTILFYQYGDGTYDGSGKLRYDSNYLNVAMEGRIKKANEELNSNKELIKKFLDRVVFQGVDVNARSADALYYGDVRKGNVITKKQMFKYVDYKISWSSLNQIHIGPIFIRPNTRALDYSEKQEYRRHRVECHWYCIKEDVAFIQKRFNNYTS